MNQGDCRHWCLGEGAKVPRYNISPNYRLLGVNSGGYYAARNAIGLEVSGGPHYFKTRPVNLARHPCPVEV